MERKAVFIPRAKWCHAITMLRLLNQQDMKYRCWYHTQDCLLHVQHKAIALESFTFLFFFFFTVIAYITAAIAQQEISMLKECWWVLQQALVTKSCSVEDYVYNKINNMTEYKTEDCRR